MTRRKIGKPPVATIATSATRADFLAAVEVAKAAIAEAARATRRRPMNRAAVKAKLRRGEPLTEGERATVLALLEEQDRPRRRGRPKGAARHDERRAIFAAVMALYPSPLRPYRNDAAPHRFSQCDAISEAMTACGFGRFATPGAVAAEMKSIRRRSKHFIGVHFYVRGLMALSRGMVEALEPHRPTIEGAARAVLGFIEPLAVAAGHIARSEEMRALAAIADATSKKNSTD